MGEEEWQYAAEGGLILADGSPGIRVGPGAAFQSPANDYPSLKDLTLSSGQGF